MFDSSNIELPDDFFKNLNGKMKSITSLFKNYKGTKIPSFQQATTSYYSANGLFRDASHVKEIGDLVLSPESLSYAFNACSRLREFPNITLNNLDRLHTYSYGNNSYMFQNCCSLRSIPKDFLKEIYNTAATSSSNVVYTAMFGNCYALDEIVGLSPRSATLTSNMLVSVIGSNYHLQRFVFDTQEDGTPYKVNWKNQTISFYNYIGWAGYSNADKNLTTNYNSGITADKEVKNKDDYNRLKDDPDWWSREFIFSRFGHNAAVELINSLPDASDYLATQSGGNNSIIFYKNAGMSIDGGGVSDLTEEEIAVAAAKGWTISYTG